MASVIRADRGFMARAYEPHAALMREAADTITTLKGEIERLRRTSIRTAASLAAAISLLERGGKAAKKAAPSDKMFDQMLIDYRASLDAARQALGSTDNVG